MNERSLAEYFEQLDTELAANRVGSTEPKAAAQQPAEAAKLESDRQQPDTELDLQLPQQSGAAAPLEAQPRHDSLRDVHAELTNIVHELSELTNRPMLLPPMEDLEGAQSDRAELISQLANRLSGLEEQVQIAEASQAAEDSQFLPGCRLELRKATDFLTYALTRAERSTRVEKERSTVFLQIKWLCDALNERGNSKQAFIHERLHSVIQKSKQQMQLYESVQLRLLKEHSLGLLSEDEKALLLEQIAAARQGYQDAMAAYEARTAEWRAESAQQLAKEPKPDVKQDPPEPTREGAAPKPEVIPEPDVSELVAIMNSDRIDSALTLVRKHISKNRAGLAGLDTDLGKLLAFLLKRRETLTFLELRLDTTNNQVVYRMKKEGEQPNYFQVGALGELKRVLAFAVQAAAEYEQDQKQLAPRAEGAGAETLPAEAEREGESDQQQALRHIEWAAKLVTQLLGEKSPRDAVRGVQNVSKLYEDLKQAKRQELLLSDVEDPDLEAKLEQMVQVLSALQVEMKRRLQLSSAKGVRGWWKRFREPQRDVFSYAPFNGNADAGAQADAGSSTAQEAAPADALPLATEQEESQAVRFQIEEILGYSPGNEEAGTGTLQQDRERITDGLRVQMGGSQEFSQPTNDRLRAIYALQQGEFTSQEHAKAEYARSAAEVDERTRAALEAANSRTHWSVDAVLELREVHDLNYHMYTMLVSRRSQGAPPSKPELRYLGQLEQVRLRLKSIYEMMESGK